MSLTHMKYTMARRRVTIAMVAIAPILPVTARALPQATETRATSSGRGVVAGTRCPECPDSTRVRRTVLATKLDSLRTEFERRRMTTAEHEVLSKEMAATIMALTAVIEAGVRADLADMQGARVSITRPPSPEARASARSGMFGYTFQVGPKRGYLGVTFDGPMLSDNNGRELTVRFFQYPLIASVDPSSPAERAGVLRGDTLIALNGTDVIDRSFSFTRLLVPDEKVTLKVRRQGDAKEFRVIVGEAPAYVVQRMPYPTPAAVAHAAPDAPSAFGQVGVRASQAPTARVVPDAPEPADAPVAAFAYPGRVLFIGGGVGGARMEPVSEGLASNLGIKGGLHVSRVPPGSPSDRWGFREGDIVLTAAGEPMTEVQDLARVVADRYKATDGVKIVVLRDKKRHDLILK